MAILIEDPVVKAYCEKYSSKGHPILREINDFNRANTRSPEDGSDFVQGRFLSFLSHMMQPRLALELGTFTAYSTICLAEGLAPGGKLITIEGKPHLEPVIRTHLAKAGIEDKVELKIGKAQEIINTIDGPLDLVFMDASKRRYFVFFEMLVEKMRKGGLILADNTLWKGTVLVDEKDKMAQAIHDFNRLLRHDDRVEKLLLPLRDGLTLIRKR